MLQGRWKSQAFLDYIRPQVSTFSAGLSELMLENGTFSTIPDRHTDSSEDPIMFNPEVSYLDNELFPTTNPVRVPRLQCHYFVLNKDLCDTTYMSRVDFQSLFWQAIFLTGHVILIKKIRMTPQCHCSH